jgi:hypothetical protein
MPFTPSAINYAVQYGKELANAYPYLSYFGDIWGSQNSQRFRPINANSIMIPSMEVGGAHAVNRDAMNGQFTRKFNLTWEPKVMTMYREWDTILDEMDIVETNEVATIANITRTFNEFQKIPEMDAYMASKLGAFATAASTADSTALTAANILGKWDDYLEAMTNARVNRDRVICYVTPATYKLLKQAAGITRFLEVANGIQAVDRNIAKLDGVRIVEVPSDLMQSAYDFTDGFAATAAAKQINLIMVDPLAVIAPVVYEVSMISAPSAATKGKNVYYESYYYDVFNLTKRTAGIRANISA